MKHILTVFKRELTAYFNNPLAYVLILIFNVLSIVFLLLLSDFFHWKKSHDMLAPQGEPIFFDLYDIGTLKEAEKFFYKIGAEADEARDALFAQLGPLEELARFVDEDRVERRRQRRRADRDRRILRRRLRRGRPTLPATSRGQPTRSLR